MTEFLKYPGESSNDHLPPEGKRLAHSRRVFLFKLSLALNAAVGAVLAVPLVGYLLGPIGRKSDSAGSARLAMPAERMPFARVNGFATARTVWLATA